MFKVNPDGMRMEPTPERVLSVCRLVSHKSMSRDEVRQCMTLGINDEKELDQSSQSMWPSKNLPSSKLMLTIWS